MWWSGCAGRRDLRDRDLAGAGAVVRDDDIERRQVAEEIAALKHAAAVTEVADRRSTDKRIISDCRVDQDRRAALADDAAAGPLAVT